MSPPAPTALQLDALREVANVGCGHAATALSRLVGGRKVQLEVPRVVLTAIPEMSVLMGGADAVVVAAVLRIEGEVEGHLMLALPERDARQLCAVLLDRPCEGRLDELQRSALAEAANIVASACMTAIGALTGLRLLPTPPTLSLQEAGEVLKEALQGADARGLVVVLEARFQTALNPSIGGQLLVLPDEKGLATLLSRLGV